MSAGLASLGGECPEEKEAEKKHCLSSYEPLPNSKLWWYLEDYYRQAALDAWKKNVVPMFVTSNSRFARFYARQIRNYILEHYKRPGIDKTKPIYILEIGGGHGKFTFAVLLHLLRNKKLWASKLPPKAFVYVFSDVAACNLAAVEKQPRMAQWIEEGYLDTAIFDAGASDVKIYLQHQKKEVLDGYPIIAIANYVFDSLLIDAFRIQDKVLRRFLLALYAPKSTDSQDFDYESSSIIPHVSLLWGLQTIRTNYEELGNPDKPLHEPSVLETFLNDPNPLPVEEITGKEGTSSAKLEGVLSQSVQDKEVVDPMDALPDYMANSIVIQDVIKHYLKKESSGLSFTVPIGSILLLERLRKKTNDQLYVIIGDKGYPDDSEFEGFKNPHIAVHGTFSFMVNLHALKLAVHAMGGFHCSTPYKDTFQVTSLFLGGSVEDFSQTITTFYEEMEDVPDGLMALQKHQLDEENPEGVSIREKCRRLLALLRYSGFDSEVFLNMRGKMLDLCGSIFGPRISSDILYDIQKVFQHWLKLKPSEDVPDIAAHICMKLGKLEQAIRYFMLSEIYCPEGMHPATHVNMAACYKNLGMIEEATKRIESALEMNPTFTAALNLRTELRMINHRIRIAIVGYHEWACRHAVPILTRDRRCEIVAIYCSNSKTAEGLRASDNLKKIEIFDFSDLKSLLARKDVDACVLDAHSSIVLQYLPKFWAAGKHTLTRGPGALSVASAKKLRNAYISHQEQMGLQSVAWHAASPARREESFRKASEKSNSLGAPLWFQMRNMRKEHLYPKEQGGENSWYSIPEILAQDVLNDVTAILTITDAKILSISSRIFPDKNTPGFTEDEKNCTRAAGWILLSCGNKNFSGSFLNSRGICEDSIRYVVGFENGQISVTSSAYAWNLERRIKVAGAPRIEEWSFQQVANQNSHDEWFKQIHSKRRNFTENVPYVTTLDDCLCDSATLEGIIKSCADGEIVEFSYEKIVT